MARSTRYEGAAPYPAEQGAFAEAAEPELSVEGSLCRTSG